MANTTLNKVRIGIVGCGGIANGKHMPSLSRLDNIEMVAFCDIVADKAECGQRVRRGGRQDVHRLRETAGRHVH